MATIDPEDEYEAAEKEKLWNKRYTAPEHDSETREKILEKDIVHLAECGIERIIQKLREAKKPIKTLMEFETNRLEFKTRTENEEITVIIEPLKK